VSLCVCVSLCRVCYGHTSHTCDITHVYVCKSVFDNATCMFVYTYLYMYVYIYTCLYVCVYTCMYYMCVYICMYYMCVYIRTAYCMWSVIQSNPPISIHSVSFQRNMAKET